MFGIGMPEIAVIIVVALLVLGPKRLPEVARALGKGLAEFRRVTGEVNKELQTAKDLIENEAREHETQRRARERERIQREKVLGRQGDAAEGSAPTDPSYPDATAASSSSAGATVARSASSSGETAATASASADSSIESPIDPTPVTGGSSAKA
jgi:sec-independent protein translocase protein TatB